MSKEAAIILMRLYKKYRRKISDCAPNRAFFFTTAERLMRAWLLLNCSSSAPGAPLNTSPVVP